MLNFALVCILFSITRLITQILNAFATPASLPRTRHFGRILIQSENPQIMGSDRKCKSQFPQIIWFHFSADTTEFGKLIDNQTWKIQSGLRLA